MIMQQELRREEERAEAAKQKHIQEVFQMELARNKEIERKTERNQQNFFHAMMLQAFSPQTAISPKHTPVTAPATNPHKSALFTHK